MGTSMAHGDSRRRVSNESLGFSGLVSMSVTMLLLSKLMPVDESLPSYTISTFAVFAQG